MKTLAIQLAIVGAGFLAALMLVLSSPVSHGLDGKAIIASMVLVLAVVLAYNFPDFYDRWIHTPKGGVR